VFRDLGFRRGVAGPQIGVDDDMRRARVDGTIAKALRDEL
jgi:hypothetical protein